jgi:hypothetical protein
LCASSLDSLCILGFGSTPHSLRLLELGKDFGRIQKDKRVTRFHLIAFTETIRFDPSGHFTRNTNLRSFRLPHNDIIRRCQ